MGALVLTSKCGISAYSATSTYSPCTSAVMESPVASDATMKTPWPSACTGVTTAMWFSEGATITSSSATRTLLHQNLGQSTHSFITFSNGWPLDRWPWDGNATAHYTQGLRWQPLETVHHYIDHLQCFLETVQWTTISLTYFSYACSLLLNPGGKSSNFFF